MHVILSLVQNCDLTVQRRYEIFENGINVNSSGIGC